MTLTGSLGKPSAEMTTSAPAQAAVRLAASNTSTWSNRGKQTLVK